MEYLEKLYDAVLNGDPPTAISLTEQALAENIDPHVLINDYMIRAMDEDAYMLCSLVGDLKIAEVVDVPNMLVIMHFPKSILTQL